MCGTRRCRVDLLVSGPAHQSESQKIFPGSSVLFFLVLKSSPTSTDREDSRELENLTPECWPSLLLAQVEKEATENPVFTARFVLQLCLFPAGWPCNSQSSLRNGDKVFSTSLPAYSSVQSLSHVLLFATP